MQRACARGGRAGPDHSTRACQSREPLAGARAGQSGPVEDHLAGQLESLGTSGKPLPEATRNDLEPRLGHDFRNVRVHAGPQAASLARGLQARAFTVGRDIFFGAGEFAPGSRQGRHLLAHELTHTAQQGASPRRPTPESRRAEAPQLITTLPNPVAIQRRTFDCPTAPVDRAKVVDQAVSAARSDTRHALSLLQSVDVASAAETYNPRLIPAFEKFFGDFDDQGRVTDVAARLAQVMTQLNSAGSAYHPGPPLPLRCADGDDCGSSNAVTVGNKEIFFCDPFFKNTPIAREGTVIHEIVHTLYTDEPDAYTYVRLFDLLRGEPTTDPTASSMAVLAPDSFAAFVLAVSGVGLEQAKTKGSAPTDRLRGFRGSEQDEAAARRAVAVAGFVIRQGKKGLTGDLAAYLAGFKGSDEEVRSNLKKMRRVFTRKMGLVIRRRRRGKAVKFRSPEIIRDRFKFSDEFFDLDQGAQAWAVVDAVIDGLELPEAAAYSRFLRRHARSTQPYIPGL